MVYANYYRIPLIGYWRNEQKIVSTVHSGQNPEQNKQPQLEICDDLVICLHCLYTLSDCPRLDTTSPCLLIAWL